MRITCLAEASACAEMPSRQGAPGRIKIAIGWSLGLQGIVERNTVPTYVVAPNQ